MDNIQITRDYLGRRILDPYRERMLKYDWPAEVMGSAKSLPLLNGFERYVMYLYYYMGFTDRQILRECGLSTTSRRYMKRKRKAIMAKMIASDFPDPEFPVFSYRILLNSDLTLASSSELPPHN